MLVHMLRLFEKTRRIDENTLAPSTTQRKRKNKKRKEEMKTQIKEKDKDVICDILMQENTDRKNATGKMKHKLFLKQISKQLNKMSTCEKSQTVSKRTN